VKPRQQALLFPRISHILKDLAELKRICIAYLWFSKELSCIKQRILACAPRFPRKYDMVPRIYGFLKGLIESVRRVLQQPDHAVLDAGLPVIPVASPLS